MDFIIAIVLIVVGVFFLRKYKYSVVGYGCFFLAAYLIFAGIVELYQ